jgi:hypothetical protein
MLNNEFIALHAHRRGALAPAFFCCPRSAGAHPTLAERHLPAFRL